MSKDITVVVTTPKGSRVEYVVDATGLLRVVRILVAAHFPANAGVVRGTNTRVLVLGQEPIEPLASLRARVIGAIQDTLVAVHLGDPVVADIDDLAQLPVHLRAELTKFIATAYAG